jgi:hypothetical protein
MGKINHCIFRLYIDGKKVDEQVAPAWADIIGGTLILRGQLSPNVQHDVSLGVKLEIRLRFFCRSYYKIYIEDQLVHKEYATWQAV